MYEWLSLLSENTCILSVLDRMMHDSAAAVSQPRRRHHAGSRGMHGYLFQRIAAYYGGAT